MAYPNDVPVPLLCFTTRTAGVQAVYSGRCIVYGLTKRHGSGRVRAYNGSNADPLKVDYTPAAALTLPAQLIPVNVNGEEWNLGITLDNTSAEEVAVWYKPIP